MSLNVAFRMVQDERQAGMMSTITSLWESCRALYRMLPVSQKVLIAVKISRPVQGVSRSHLGSRTHPVTNKPPCDQQAWPWDMMMMSK